MAEPFVDPIYQEHPPVQAQDDDDDQPSTTVEDTCACSGLDGDDDDVK